MSDITMIRLNNLKTGQKNVYRVSSINILSLTDRTLQITIGSIMIEQEFDSIEDAEETFEHIAELMN